MTLKNEIKKTKEREAREKKCKTVKYKGYTFNWYVMPLAIVLYHMSIMEEKITKVLDKTLFAWNETKAKKIIDKTFPKLQIVKMVNFGTTPTGARAFGQATLVQFTLSIKNGLTEINTNYMSM